MVYWDTCWNKWAAEIHRIFSPPLVVWCGLRRLTHRGGWRRRWRGIISMQLPFVWIHVKRTQAGTARPPPLLRPPPHPVAAACGILAPASASHPAEPRCSVCFACCLWARFAVLFRWRCPLKAAAVALDVVGMRGCVVVCFDGTEISHTVVEVTLDSVVGARILRWKVVVLKQKVIHLECKLVFGV